MDKKLVNISKKFKCFTFTPPKTASLLATKVFDNFEFDTYEIRNNKILYEKKGFTHIHHLPTFDEYQDFDFIISVRNPYSKYFSFLADFPTFDRKKYVEKLEKSFTTYNLNLELRDLLQKKKPNYVLKFEELYESYMKIPFVKNSEFFRSGEFQKIFDSKPHERIQKYNWKKYYDRGLADLIYYNNHFLFEMFGYDKDSWKT